MDRNTQRRDFKALGLPSLSARRAWIEILQVIPLEGPTTVALRKESVDRNPKLYQALSHVRWSLSARRAWIEIKSSIVEVSKYVSLSARRAWIEMLMVLCLFPCRSVALRKESVDRNYRLYY